MITAQILAALYFTFVAVDMLPSDAPLEHSIIQLTMADGGRGTGFAAKTATGEHVVITNAHVCRAELFLMHQKSRSIFIVLKLSQKVDLCMLQLVQPSRLSLPPLKLAESVERYEKLHTIGYPHGIGHITQSGQYIDNYHATTAWPSDDQCDQLEFLKRDRNGICLAIQKNLMFTNIISAGGASGSPIFNSDNEVVGVVTLVTSTFAPWAIGVSLSSLKEFLGYRNE